MDVSSVAVAIMSAFVAAPPSRSASSLAAGLRQTHRSRGRAAPARGWRAAVLVGALGLLHVAAVVQPSADGTFTVSLTRQQIPLHTEGGAVHYKSAYYGAITMGEPAQTFDVVFDTGSGHLVLPSTLCASATCRAHRRYQRRTSRTSVDIDVDGTKVFPLQPRDQITVSFGTGEIQGVFVSDTMCLGPQAKAEADEEAEGSISGASFFQSNRALLRNASALEDTGRNSTGAENASSPNGCVTLRAIAATDMTTDPFASFRFDGILGLGLPSLSQTPEFNFLEVAARAGTWTAMPGMERMFAVFLATSEDEQGEITFGGYRRERMGEGELAWCNVVDPDHGYWQLEIKSIKAGGTLIDFCGPGAGCRAVVDTGTSLLGVPSSLGPTLVRHLRHTSKSPGGSCGSDGPLLEIDLGNFTVVLDPTEYARPELIEFEDNPWMKANAVPCPGDSAANKTSEDVGTKCVPSVMHIDLPLPLSPRTLILGEPVLQKYYSAFDVGGPRIGFAPAIHASRTRSTVVL